MADSKATINVVAAYLIAGLGIATSAAMVAGSLPNFGTVSDLPEFFAGACMLVSGQAASIYNTASLFASEKLLFPMLSRGIALFVPPQGILLLAPLSLVPAPVSLALWTIVLIAAVLAAIFLLAAHAKLSRQEGLWLVGTVFLSGPLVESLRIGQLAPLMLLALVACLRLAESRPYVAGALLNVLFFKPQELFPLLFFAGAALRKRILFSALAVAVLLTALSVVVFTVPGIWAYAALIVDPASANLMQSSLNPTVRGQSMRIPALAPLSNWLTAGGVLLAVLVGLRLGWLSRRQAHWLTIGLAAALPLALVTALHCHDYDLLLLVPGAVLLVKTQLWQGLSGWIKLIFMLVVACFLQPFYSDIHYGYLLRGGIVNPHFWALLLYAAFTCTAALRYPEKLAPHS